jgi:hypothetical protein
MVWWTSYAFCSLRMRALADCPASIFVVVWKEYSPTMVILAGRDRMSVEAAGLVQYCAVSADSPWVFPGAMFASLAVSSIVKGSWVVRREALSIH